MKFTSGQPELTELKLLSHGQNDREKEENEWHEMANRMALERKIQEYVEQFTVHSLTKVMAGRKVESTFWFFMLTGSLILSITVCYGLISKYLRYEIYTDIKAVVTNQNHFPSVTICDFRLLKDSYFSYCGVRPREFNEENTNTMCSFKELSHTPIEKASNHSWSNGLFTVTSCKSWGGKECRSSRHLKTLGLYNNSCFTWNYDGKYHDVYGQVSIKFKFENPTYSKETPQIVVFPHDHEVLEIDITHKVDIDINKLHLIKLDKAFMLRLKHPYPSDCHDGKEGDIFPGKYTRRSCIETFNLMRMYKECGQVSDYVKHHLPVDVFEKYQQNKTIGEARSCIMQYSHETEVTENCPFPCKEMDLGIMSDVKELDESMKNKSEYRVDVQLQRVDTYKVFQEQALYSWNQLLCEIGGFLGLVMGASVLSFVEIIVYCILKIVHKCCYMKYS